MSFDLSRVRVSGPLSGLAAGFTDHVVQRGYRPISACKHTWLFNHLSNWLVSEGLGVEELARKEVERFQHNRCAAEHTYLPSIGAMAPILGYLRGLGIAPTVSPAPITGALEAMPERHRSYLMVEGGVQRTTACRYIGHVRPFLQTSVTPDGLALDFRRLTAADVISFVVASCRRPDPG
jgi:integrase/recombinase XerD